MKRERRLSVGAEVTSDGVHFRVYAAKRRSVDAVVIDAGGRERPVALTREADGHFSAFAPGVRAGARYGFRLDGGAKVLPDPASRFQPEGPHGLSEVVDPRGYAWTDAAWRGKPLRGQVLYELHVGTFTREGTYRAAMSELGELASAGITLIELMPLAEFPGRFGWGYDGVDLYAPSHLYGRPDDLRAFVDRAHALGLGVVLDVVYNHLGPSGNYLREYADTYFTDKYANEWGDAIDFESDPHARAYFVENAGYWIDEFHFDGLRLDATQSIHDASERHVLADIQGRARRASAGREVLLFAENEPQNTDEVRPIDRGGHGLDALWNDDFHHAARVALTGRREAYYVNTGGTPQELVSAIKWGYLYQGQYYPWQKQARGLPAFDVEASRFVLYLQNHDQVANSARGERLHRHTSPGRLRAITTLVLLAPGTPLLFMGQEFGASAPFLYFADHEPELAGLVKEGRLDFLQQFSSMKDDAVRCLQLAPHDPATFERCKLDFTERERNRAVYDLHRDLLRLRREDTVFSAQRSDWLHGAVVGPEAFVLRFATGTGDDRLLLVNLGPDVDLGGAAEPLLAPPRGGAWRVLFSTEDPRYGACGTPAVRHPRELTVLAHSALVLAPGERKEATES